MSINDIDIPVLLSQLSPQNLFFLRQTSTRFNELITLNDIYNRIIECICNRLRNILGNKYDKFLKLMEKMNIALHGEFVVQCALGEYWTSNKPITFNMIGDWNKHIFDEYAMIDNMVKRDAAINNMVKHDQLRACAYYKHVTVLGRTYVPLNGYETINNRKLVLTNSKHYDCNDPLSNINIFKNAFKLVNGKPNLHIKKHNNIMHKTEFMDRKGRNIQLFAHHIIMYNLIGYLVQFGFEWNFKN